MKALLVEDVIARDTLNINIDFGVSRTQHSSERQSRHEGDYISNEEVTENVEAAFKNVTSMLIFDTLDIGDPIIIKNLDTYLNIVGVPLRGGRNELIFKLITVMRKENFVAKQGTKVIKIRNKDL